MRDLSIVVPQGETARAAVAVMGDLRRLGAIRDLLVGEQTEQGGLDVHWVLGVNRLYQIMQDGMKLMHDMKGQIMMGGTRQGGMQSPAGKAMAGGEIMKSIPAR